MSEIDKVDANGNPIVEAETVSLPKKDYDDMVEKLADKTQTTANLVAEIKDLREKKQLTEAEALDLKKKLEQQPVVPTDGSVLTPERIIELTNSSIESALAKKDAEVAETNRANAMSAFLSKNKEFHPDNDQGGLKLSALQRKVAMFNTGSIKTEADFLTVLEDANRLLSNTSVQIVPGTDPNPPAPNGTRSGTPAPVVDNDNTLSAKELNIIERSFDGDRERYIKIRAKRPDYVATLLQYSL